MCTYTFTLDDKLVEQVRPAFRDNNAIQEWLQSQMELFVRQYVKKIATKKKAEDDIAERISQLSNLMDDWDGYGAPTISEKAIENAKTALKGLPNDAYLAMDILPTEYGGVQMKFKSPKGLSLSCNFGDDNMSYYVDKDGEDTVYRSFLTYNNENIAQFRNYLTA